MGILTLRRVLYKCSTLARKTPMRFRMFRTRHTTTAARKKMLGGDEAWLPTNQLLL